MVIIANGWGDLLRRLAPFLGRLLVSRTALLVLLKYRINAKNQNKSLTTVANVGHDKEWLPTVLTAGWLVAQ
jgi:hypothetical protein